MNIYNLPIIGLILFLIDVLLYETLLETPSEWWIFYQLGTIMIAGHLFSSLWTA